MRLISDRDLRNYPGKVREALARGEVVVTSRGKPYAVMLPVDDPDRLDDTLKLAARLRAQMSVSEIRKRAAAAGLDRITDEEILEEIRQARNQGASD
jgi:prevent-host-death family protein